MRVGDKRAAFRRRLDEDTILILVGVPDVLTALVAEQAGIEGLYHSGYATAAHQYGVPDIGLIGLAEMAASLSRLSARTTLPVVVDGDTGFGGLPAVRRTVQIFEAAGAAAVQIEDQQSPKRCGHLAGKQVVEAEEMVEKVAAAVAERSDPDLVIVARTDALQVNGLEDAIERCSAYAAAGADLVLVDGPGSIDELSEIARRVDAPLLANMTEMGRSPLLSAGELEDLGYSVVLFPASFTGIAVKAFSELCAHIAREGTTRDYRENMAHFEEVNALLKIEEWERS